MSGEVHIKSSRDDLPFPGITWPVLDPVHSGLHMPIAADEPLDRKNTTTLHQLIHRLDALLMVLKTCKERQCTHPWETLFPEDILRYLGDALDPSFEDFFEREVSNVKFQMCEKGYNAESEGPMWDGKQVYGLVDEVAAE